MQTSIPTAPVILSGPWAAWAWPVLVTAGVAVIAFVLLRRRPLTALALLLALSLAVALPVYWQGAIQTVTQGIPQLQAVPSVLAGAEVSLIAATRPSRFSVAAAVAALGVQVGGWAVTPGQVKALLSGHLPVVTTHAGQLPWLSLGTPQELAVALITIIAWLIGHSIRQAHVHSQALRAQEATAERLRIARDLHDMVAHSVGIIAIQAGMGRRVIDTQPGEARDALAAIEATSRETLAGLRCTVGALRRPGPPAETEEASLETPGLADLARLVAKTRDASVRVDVRRHGQQRPLPAEVDTSAYRIIQEAVANVVRHAGTKHCQVSIDHRDEELSIEVTDDGCGEAVAGSGYGIAGMRERATLLHGELTAGPRPEGGFRVTARLPVPATAALPSADADRLPAPAAMR